jgi:hypothetical protein
MSALFLNILLLLLSVGGAIVSSLTLSNATWRPRAIKIFGLIGLVSLVLTIFAYSNFGLADISNVAADAAAAFMMFTRNHSWFWPALCFLIGLVIGAHFGVFITNFSSRKKFDSTPRVSRWLDAADAIPQFADATLTSELKRLRAQLPRLNSEIDSSKRMYDEKKLETPVGSDDVPRQLLARSAAIGSLAAQHRQAIENANRVGEEAWRKEIEVLADIIAQLKRGTLVGKGFRHRLNRVADTAGMIPIDHWQLLHFETYDQKRQTVEGGGKKYVGLQLGRNENSPS